MIRFLIFNFFYLSKIFTIGHLEFSSGGLGTSSSHLEKSSSHLSELAINDSNRDSMGCLIVKMISTPLIDDLDVLNQNLLKKLEQSSSKSRDSGKLPKTDMSKIILQLCKNYFLTLKVLSLLLGRDANSLRKNYLSGMVRSKQLTLAYPKSPTHPQQAYMTNRGNL